MVPVQVCDEHVFKAVQRNAGPQQLMLCALTAVKQPVGAAFCRHPEHHARNVSPLHGQASTGTKKEQFHGHPPPTMMY
ncbi:hypothetical protein GCM10025857_09300 [Alicyclobacillus contaminans]|nr:hypothetical protein GCM10025857_09300 [Alicyclobacillus contaminans]